MNDFLHDFKRGLKAIWAQAAQGKKPSLEDLSIGKILWRNRDPLSEVLTHLVLRDAGRLAPPLIPRITPMPIAELCQLVLLWNLAGEREAASALAHSIPLDFPWMWCRENEYLEEETIASIALLRRALGNEEEAIVGGDPYFQALANALSQLPPFSEAAPLLDCTQIRAGEIRGALSFSGLRTSLGALISDAAEIRAFGPQGFPLSDPRGFGIRQIAQHGNRWASPTACPEVWFETKVHHKPNEIVLELVFFGLKPTSPFVFSFYAKADTAEIGSEKLKFGTLTRYQGPAKPVVFGGGLEIESLIPGKLEVIPLAGSGGYWDCEYLAAFEIHPITAKMAFSVKAY